MNEVIKSGQTMLPETLEDLTQFVLVGKAKVQAYMLKLQAVNRLSVAQEIRDQTLKEAQEVSNAVIAAECRIGELLQAIPKAQGFASTIRDNDVQNAKTKTETIKDMGYGEREAKDYQQMAKHPEVVQAVIDKALQDGEIVTKASVMREIKFYKERIDSLEKQKRQLSPDAKLQQKLILAEREATRLEKDYQKAR